jgi:predicted aspartyl protease
MPRVACRALVLIVALGGLGACAALPPSAGGSRADACRPPKRVELALHTVRNFLLAQATLDGKPATLLIDTGAETSTLSPRAVAALHLRRSPGHGRMLAGVAGNVRSDTVRVDEMAMAGVVVASARVMAIGDLPSLAEFDPPIAGLLGADVLAQGEVELDLPNGRMALYSPSPCKAYLPWPGAMPVPLQQTPTGLVFVDAEVDGQTMRALLDTGARTSLLTREAAHALGVTEATLAGDESRTGLGVGRASLSMRRHRFASLGLPGAIDHDVPVDVTDIDLPGVKMLLGADFLARRQVWISYAADRLFVR